MIFNVYRDKNKGLVKQVVVALHRKNILRLTNTYLNMSISDLAQKVSLPSSAEAEEHLMAMVFFQNFLFLYTFIKN